MPKPSASSRARKIKLLLFDVDGVLTDGKLFFLPAPAGVEQQVSKQDTTARAGSSSKASMPMTALRFLWRGSVESRPGLSPSECQTRWRNALAI